MPKPTTRLLAALELLQTHASISGRALSERLAVDERTVRRYIATLEDLGIPITAERGRHGSYSLVAGFKLPPMLFNDDEALALAVGLLAARNLGLSSAAPAVASAQAKLSRVLPKALQKRLAAIDQTVSLGLSRPAAPGNDAALTVLSLAASERTRVRLRYLDSDGGETVRDLDPYGLARRQGRWYAVGHCHLRRDLRSFRLDRIVAALPLQATFERPADFDTQGALARSIASLPRAHQVVVHLDTTLDLARKSLFAAFGVLEALGPHARRGVRLRVEADDLAWVARELVRLPFGFRIVEPKPLRGLVEAQAKAALKSAKRLS